MDRQTDRDRAELLTKWASRTHAVLEGLSSCLLSHTIRPIRFESWFYQESQEWGSFGFVVVVANFN